MPKRCRHDWFTPASHDPFLECQTCGRRLGEGGRVIPPFTVDLIVSSRKTLQLRAHFGAWFERRDPDIGRKVAQAREREQVRETIA